jgi:hypothetical protein
MINTDMSHDGRLGHKDEEEGKQGDAVVIYLALKLP